MPERESRTVGQKTRDNCRHEVVRAPMVIVTSGSVRGPGGGRWGLGYLVTDGTRGG